MNRLLSGQFAGLEELAKAKGIDAVLDLTPNLPLMEADERRLNQALENLIKHAIVSTPAGEKLSISSSRLGDRVVIHLRHKVRRLSEDDLDKFFFPHIEETGEGTIMDLPLARVVVHRHGGKVDLFEEGENAVVLRIELPEKPSGKGRE